MDNDQTERVYEAQPKQGVNRGAMKSNGGDKDANSQRKLDLDRPELPNEFHKKIRALGILDVPKEWKVGTQPRYVYPQQCYSRSFHYATHDARYKPGVWLVHGRSLLGPGGHAWVELPDGLVFDAVVQRWFRNYYGRGDDGQMAEAWYKYDPMAVVLIHRRMNLLQTEMDDYCYHRWLQLPWGNPQNPLVIDITRAEELLKGRTPREIVQTRNFDDRRTR